MDAHSLILQNTLHAGTFYGSHTELYITDAMTIHLSIYLYQNKDYIHETKT